LRHHLRIAGWLREITSSSPENYFPQIAAEKWRRFSQTGIKICSNLRVFSAAICGNIKG